MPKPEEILLHGSLCSLLNSPRRVEGQGHHLAVTGPSTAVLREWRPGDGSCLTSALTCHGASGR